jgi:hypothetical protein
LLTCFTRPASLAKLETSISKKDEIIAAKDRKIAALEAIDSSTQSLNRGTALHQYVQQTVASAPIKSANEVSDDSCDAESHISIGSLGLSFLRQDSSRDEDDSTGEDGDDGRWNIPFDDTNEDDLVPKSADHALPLANALRDIGFKSIEDVDTSDIAEEMATLAVSSSPAKPTAARGVSVVPFRLGVSPIVPTARRGITRVDSNGSEKENVDPIRKRLSIEKCSSQGFGSSPCR